ncbi:MAG: hypothetical protein ACPH4H_07675, partial [Candidatus Poseidoniaceae archaeon]
MAKPILVTGFEAFGEHEINVSEGVAKSLEGMEVRGHKIRSLILSVDFEGSNTVASMLDEEEFAAILHIGLAASVVGRKLGKLCFLSSVYTNFVTFPNFQRQLKQTHLFSRKLNTQIYISLQSRQ